MYDIAFNTVSDESKCNEEYQFFELPDERVTGYWDKQIGSVLAIRESRLTSIVSDLITQINSALWDKKTLNPRSIVDLHNIFTDYLYVLLSVSSGYRPVREPFGRLVDIDVRTKKYFNERLVLEFSKQKNMVNRTDIFENVRFLSPIFTKIICFQDVLVFSCIC